MLINVTRLYKAQKQTYTIERKYDILADSAMISLAASTANARFAVSVSQLDGEVLFSVILLWKCLKLCDILLLIRI